MIQIVDDTSLRVELMMWLKQLGNRPVSESDCLKLKALYDVDFHFSKLEGVITIICKHIYPNLFSVLIAARTLGTQFMLEVPK